MTVGHVVVAGGAGFLGSHLCERLIGCGYRVTCLDNLLTGHADNLAELRTSPKFEFIECDVTQSIPGLAPVHYVLNLASPASPVDYLRHPIETLRAGATGTENLLNLAASHRSRFLMASTSEVYGDPEIHPQPEHYWGRVNPIGPRSVYDEAKRYAEALTVAYRREYRVDTAIVRIFNTYGSRMRMHDGRAVPTFIRQSLLGEPITIAGDGAQTRSLCYVDDLIAGLCLMMTAREHGPINLGNPHELSIRDLAHQVRRQCGSDSPLTFVDRPTDDPHNRRPDISRARALGWSPTTPLDDGLAMTIDWFRKRLVSAETA